jgi:hypothetical protein
MGPSWRSSDAGIRPISVITREEDVQSVSCTIDIENNTSKALRFWKVEDEDQWGEAMPGYPAKEILPEKTTRAFVWTGKQFQPGGAEAAVWYTLNGDETMGMRIKFNIRATPGRNNEITVATNNKKLMGAYSTPLTNHLAESVVIMC